MCPNTMCMAAARVCADALTARVERTRKWLKVLVPAPLLANALEEMNHGQCSPHMVPMPPPSQVSPIQGTTARSRLSSSRTPRERAVGGLLPSSPRRGGTGGHDGAIGFGPARVRAEDAAETREVLDSDVRRVANTAKFVSNARRTFAQGEVNMSRSACGLHVSEALAQCELDGSGRMEYLRACAELNTRPNPHVLYQLNEQRLVLQDAALERRGGQVASERLVAELYPEAIALSRALAVNTLVLDIDVSSPLCVGQGGRVLVEAIAAANAARRLRLCFKTLSEPAVSSLAAFLAPREEGSQRRDSNLNFTDQTRSVCKLEHLDLGSTHVADRGITRLSRALVGNHVLTSLCLRKCNVTAEGATALAEVLIGGKGGVLRELDVSWNHISPAGMKALLLALAGASAQEACEYAATFVPDAARVLRRLAARGGGRPSAGADGMGAVTAAGSPSLSSEPNVSLTSLDLSWNRIGGKEGQREGLGVYALAICLARNSTLERLDISHASLDKVEAEAELLSAALADNAVGLKMLMLEGNRIGSCNVLLRALMNKAPRLTFQVSSEPAHANPAQLLASLLPIHLLQDNPSGRYQLDLLDPRQRAVANWIVQRTLVDGDDPYRGEMLNGRHVCLPEVLNLLEAVHDSSDPTPQLLQLDFIAPPVQGGDLVSEATLQHAVACIRRISAPLLRLAVVRALSSDHVVDTMSVMLILSALDSGYACTALSSRHQLTHTYSNACTGAHKRSKASCARGSAFPLLFIARSDADKECWWLWAGAEREEGFIILMSRMERAAAGPVLRNLGDASFQRVVRRVGPGPFFDPSNPAGQYILRLDRRGDRRVLAQLFELAAKASKDKDRRDDKNLAPGFEDITLVGLQGLWAASPIAAAEAACAMHAKALAALATANEQRRFKENLNGDNPDPRPPGPEFLASGGEGDGKRMLEYLDQVLLHSDPTRVAAAPFAPAASASNEEARETRLGASKPGGFASAKAMLQSAQKRRAVEKLPDDKSGSAVLLDPRIGLSLPSWVLRALCKRGRHVNIARLRHWAGADGRGGGEGERNQEKGRKGSGDMGQEEAASLLLEAPSRVTQEQRIAIEQEIALRGDERRQKDALGPNLAMRQKGALASVFIWLSCIPLPPPLPSPASSAMEPQKFSVDDASDPQLGLENRSLEGGEGIVGSPDATSDGAAKQRVGGLRPKRGITCNSSSDSGDDVGEVEMLGHDADVQDDSFGLGDALVKDVPPYMQLNRDPLAARYPTMEEIDGWRQQVMSRWLPRPTSWEELQERPFKPLRSYRGKTKFVGVPLAVELKATDVLRVVFNTLVDTRLTKVLKRVRGNVQTDLRAAVLRELSGDGFSHEDYRATFLCRMLPNLPPPASPPPGDKPPKPKAPVGRNAKQQAAAELLQERRRGVQCIDIAAPREASLIDDIPATPPKWERRLFLISEIFGAAEAAAVTAAAAACAALKEASWRSGGGMKEKKSISIFSSLDKLSEAAEAGLGAGDSVRSPSNVTPEELEAEQYLEEREQEKRSVLGVHYLDDTGNPKLLFPLNGIEAVRMLPSPADQKGGVNVDEDDDCSHLTHLHHPSSTHTNILISVCYDEVTLPLWYASQQAPECLRSRTSTAAIRTSLHSPGSNPRLSRPGSGGSVGGWRGADKGLHLSAASAGPLAKIGGSGSKGTSRCLSPSSRAGPPSPGEARYCVCARCSRAR